MDDIIAGYYPSNVYTTTQRTVLRDDYMFDDNDEANDEGLTNEMIDEIEEVMVLATTMLKKLSS